MGRNVNIWPQQLYVLGGDRMIIVSTHDNILYVVPLGNLQTS